MKIPSSLVKVAMRKKQVLSPGVRAFLKHARNLFGEHPIIATPDFHRVLVVAPHPDDESVGCGGTISLLAETGAQVHVVVISDGSALEGTGLNRDELVGRRHSGTEEACRLLGVSAPRFLDLRDGNLSNSLSDISRGLEQVVEETRPEALLIPWPLDQHPDHVAVNRAICEIDIDSSTEIWGWEAWTPSIPSRIVDIGSTVERKRAAIKAHSIDPLLHPEPILALNRYRAAIAGLGAGYAEAFFAAGSKRYVELVRSL